MLRKYAAAELAAVIETEEDFNKVATDITPINTDARPRKIVRYNPDFVYARFKAIGSIEIDGQHLQ